MAFVGGALANKLLGMARKHDTPRPLDDAQENIDRLVQETKVSSSRMSIAFFYCTIFFHGISPILRAPYDPRPLTHPPQQPFPSQALQAQLGAQDVSVSELESINVALQEKIHALHLEAREIERHTESLEATNGDLVQRSAELTELADQLTSERDALKTQLVHLQAATDAQLMALRQGIEGAVMGFVTRAITLGDMVAQLQGLPGLDLDLAFEAEQLAQALRDQPTSDPVGVVFESDWMRKIHAAVPSMKLLLEKQKHAAGPGQGTTTAAASGALPAPASTSSSTTTTTTAAPHILPPTPVLPRGGLAVVPLSFRMSPHASKESDSRILRALADRQATHAMATLPAPSTSTSATTISTTTTSTTTTTPAATTITSTPPNLMTSLGVKTTGAVAPLTPGRLRLKAGAGNGSGAGSGPVAHSDGQGNLVLTSKSRAKDLRKKKQSVVHSNKNKSPVSVGLTPVSPSTTTTKSPGPARLTLGDASNAPLRSPTSPSTRAVVPI